jgi:putative SOS response-associated peptidase YedK
MPVILHKYDYEKWLDPNTPLSEVQRLLKPVENEEIHAKVVNEEPPKDKNVRSLFDI